MGIKKSICIFVLLLSSTAYGQGVTEHVVVAGNTLYSISKTYGLTIEEVQEANPQLDGINLAIGDTIKIPGSQNPEVKRDLYEIYIVQSTDTPKKLSKEWGFTSLREFYLLNPDAKSEWRIGMYLVKPTDSGQVMGLSLSVDTIGDAVRIEITSSQEIDSTALSVIDSSQVDSIQTQLLSEVNVLTLLPFCIYEYANDSKRKGISEMSFSFRQGMELALDDLNDSTRTVKLQYRDTYNNQNTINDILKNNPLDSFDLIIGPLYAKRILELREYQGLHKLVSPMSKNPEINDLQIKNSIVNEEYQWQAIADLMLRRAKDSTEDNLPRQLLVVGQLTYITGDKIERLFSDSINATIILNQTGWKENLKLTRLSTKVHYDLIILDTDPAFVLDVIRNIRSGKASYTWNTIEAQVKLPGITPDYFAREEEVICAFSSHIDYNSVEMMTVVSEFREKYESQPNVYAINGYDIMQFYVRQLTEGTKEYRGLNMGFSPNEDGKNTFVELREFKEWEWQKFDLNLEQKDGNSVLENK